MVGTEGDIQITPRRGIRMRKFDDGKSHGLTHCMKAVDFVLEMRDKIVFVEIKDPGNPKASPAERARFVREFTSAQMDSELVYKCRDSFLYEWASDRVKKPIHYFVLVALGNLTKADLLARTDALKRQLPLLDCAYGRWKKPPIANCVVLNMETWNKHIKYCPARRISKP